VTRHPVEIYTALLFLIAAAAVAAWRRRHTPALGLPAAIVLGAAGAIRLVTEPLRPSLGDGPVLWYAAAVLAAIALAWQRRTVSQPMT
jgi:prolipoprotein diacylglyceryltransferase